MRRQLIEYLENKLQPLIEKYNIDNSEFVDVQIPPDRSKGDFSMNTAMKLAKSAKCAPRVLAEEIKTILDTENDWFDKIDIAGPGFINLYVSDSKLSQLFESFSKSDDFYMKRSGKVQTVAIDYSSINIAKQMHVGHLRSTIIGDVLARVLEAHGDTVIRQNHLGDWGLPIAMVLYKAMPVINQAIADNKSLDQFLQLEDLENFYKKAMADSKSIPEVAKACHEILVKLQQGDKELLNGWKMITSLSMKEAYRLYEILSIKLDKECERGESFYRDMLPGTLELVEKSALLSESEGAKCVFLDEFKSKDKSPLPMIVVKSDGGFNYGTFDLAAARHRALTLKADRAIYVTDARQTLHFKQVFAVAKACNLLEDSAISLEHVTFGTILGENNKPLKTRSGENVKLSDLLDEAVSKAYDVVNEKNQNLTEEQKQQVARMVGIGAVKYADLSQNRNNDYVFSFDRMLTLNGNTAPYLQYAHARICSLFRKAKINAEDANALVSITAVEERELIFKLMDLPQVVKNVANDLRPHVLCNYIYELATAFSSFYDKCPVLNCDNDELKQSRLALCNITKQVLATSLDLLGIVAPQEM